MKANGFTLIELLIVMVLIGVMAGAAMLAMGNADNGKQQQLEAERLSMLLELAEQEAMIGGDSIGVELFTQGYRFLNIRQNHWRPIDGDALFGQRTLDQRVSLSLKLESGPAYLSKGPGGPPQPQIVLTPDGESEAFSIGIAGLNSDSLLTVANSAEQGLSVATVALKP